MDSKVNYTLVGAFVLGLGALMIFIGIWLSTQGHHNVYKDYIVYAQGGVDGLTAKSPVQFYGVRVGYVDTIRLSPLNPELVELKLKIEGDTPITVSTLATLVSQGITGLVYVGLEAGRPSSRVPLQANDGEKYPVIRYKMPLLARISDTLPEITQNIRNLTVSFNNVFSDKNKQSITDILSNLAFLSKTVANDSPKINASMTSLQHILANIEPASSNFNKTLTSINQAGQHMTAAGVQANKTLENGLLMLNNLDDQVLPNLYQILQQLQLLTTNLQDFSSDISQNPAVLLRGKKTVSTNNSQRW